jgi:hypothetical protein
LSIDLGINNEGQDCKMGTVCGGMWEGRVNGGSEGEGIWVMGFIYMHGKER